MSSFASLDEAYGGFGIHQPPRSGPKKQGTGARPNAPGLSAKQKKTLDDLTSSLPISNNDDGDNFHPSTPSVPAPEPQKVPMPIEPFDPQAWAGLMTGTHNGLSDSEVLQKLNRLVRLLEDKQVAARGEPAGTNDVILYSCTGIFLLFVMDNMVNLGRKSRKF